MDAVINGVVCVTYITGVLLLLALGGYLIDLIPLLILRARIRRIIASRVAAKGYGKDALQPPAGKPLPDDHDRF